MDSCRTLVEFKRRIKEEELQAGEKNLHGRRFVNWLVQGGCRRKRRQRPYNRRRKRTRTRLEGGEPTDSDTSPEGGAGKGTTPTPSVGSKEWYRQKAQNKVEGVLTPLSTYFE